MKQKITIGIPTYNRNSHLNGALRSLLSEVDENVQIIIVDNFSTEPVEVSSKEAVEELRATGCEVNIIRNLVNIGGNCNIINVLSQINKGWLWLLGDDDEVKKGAISAIRNEILLAREDCTLIKFSQNANRYTPNGRDVYTSMDQIIAKVERHHHIWHENFMFISTSVMRVEHLASHFPKAYHYAYTCAPHVVICLLAINEGKSMTYTSSTIIDMERSSKGGEPKDETPVRLGFCALGEIEGIRYLAGTYVRSLARHLSCKHAFRHFIIGMSLDCENHRYWSSASIRIGSTSGGLHGLLFVGMGYLQRLFCAIQPIRFLFKKWGRSSKILPRWDMNRW